MSLISSKGKELSHLKYYEGKVALAVKWKKLTIPKAMIIWNTLLGAFTEKQRGVLSFWIKKTRSRKWRFQTRKALFTLHLEVSQMYCCFSSFWRQHLNSVSQSAYVTVTSSSRVQENDGVWEVRWLSIFNACLSQQGSAYPWCIGRETYPGRWTRASCNLPPAAAVIQNVPEYHTKRQIKDWVSSLTPKKSRERYTTCCN